MPSAGKNKYAAGCLGCLLAAMSAWAAPARAGSVNVDGLGGAGEWTDAAVLISDLNEPGIPDDRDIRSVAITGGPSLYVGIAAHGQFLDMAPRDANPAFSLGFAIGDGQKWARFELAYGIRRPAAERMRLIAVDGGGQDLGAVRYAAAEMLEIEVPWALLRPGLPASETVQMRDFAFSYRAVSGDITGDGQVSLSDMGVLAANWGRSAATVADGDLTGDATVNIGDLAVVAVNWGGHPYDTFDGLAAIERNLPVASHAPEPLSVLSTVAGLGGLAGYLRRRRRAIERTLRRSAVDLSRGPEVINDVEMRPSYQHHLEKGGPR